MILDQQILPTGVVDMTTILWTLILIDCYVKFVICHVVRHNRVSAVEVFIVNVTLISLKQTH